MRMKKREKRMGDASHARMFCVGCFRTKFE